MRFNYVTVLPVFLVMVLQLSKADENAEENYWLDVIKYCVLRHGLKYTDGYYIDCTNLKIKHCPSGQDYDSNKEKCVFSANGFNPNSRFKFNQTPVYKKYIKIRRDFYAEEQAALKKCTAKSKPVTVGLPSRPQVYVWCSIKAAQYCYKQGELYSSFQDQCIPANEMDEEKQAINYCKAKGGHKYFPSKINPAVFYECQLTGPPTHYKCPPPLTKFNTTTRRCDGGKSIQKLKCGQIIDNTEAYIPWYTRNLKYIIINGTKDMPISTIKRSLKTALSTYMSQTPLRFSKAKNINEAHIKIFFYLTPPTALATGALPGYDNSGELTLNMKTQFFYWPNEKQPYLEGTHEPNKADLTEILLHELGHIVGLEHVSEPNSIISVCHSIAKFRLSDNDVEEIKKLYGNNGIMEKTRAACKRGAKGYAHPKRSDVGMYCTEDGKFMAMHCENKTFDASSEYLCV